MTFKFTDVPRPTLSQHHHCVLTMRTYSLVFRFKVHVEDEIVLPVRLVPRQGEYPMMRQFVGRGGQDVLTRFSFCLECGGENRLRLWLIVLLSNMCKVRMLVELVYLHLGVAFVCGSFSRAIWRLLLIIKTSAALLCRQTLRWKLLR